MIAVKTVDQKRSTGYITQPHGKLVHTFLPTEEFDIQKLINKNSSKEFGNVADNMQTIIAWERAEFLKERLTRNKEI